MLNNANGNFQPPYWMTASSNMQTDTSRITPFTNMSPHYGNPVPTTPTLSDAATMTQNYSRPIIKGCYDIPVQQVTPYQNPQDNIPVLSPVQQSASVPVTSQVKTVDQIIKPSTGSPINIADINNATIYEKNGRWYSNNPTVQKFINIESGGRANAHNPGGADGLFQFTAPTWNRYGQGANIYDPHANFAAFKRLIADNANLLHKWGIPVTPGTLYGVHQLGGEFRTVYNHINKGTSLTDRAIKYMKSNMPKGKVYSPEEWYKHFIGKFN